MKHWTMERLAEDEESPYEVGETVILTLTGSLLRYECMVTEVCNGDLAELWCPDTNQRINMKQSRVN